MKPVFQTHLRPPDGNCLQAAVASVLELALDEVPHFVREEIGGRGDYYDRLREWLRARHGLTLLAFPAPTPERPWEVPPVYHLLSGMNSTAGDPDDAHVVVGYAGRVVHDPHPRRGPARPLHDAVVWFFVAVDPARARQLGGARVE